MGSAKRRPTVVSRAYRPSADNCARALELLLTIKKAAEPRRPTAVTTRRDQSMIRAKASIQGRSPEPRCLLTLFDLRRPGSELRLRRQLAAWRGFAVAEKLQDDCAVIVIRPGGAAR
jgi:hypothetical protein